MDDQNEISLTSSETSQIIQQTKEKTTEETSDKEAPRTGTVSGDELRLSWHRSIVYPKHFEQIYNVNANRLFTNRQCLSVQMNTQYCSKVSLKRGPAVVALIIVLFRRFAVFAERLPEYECDRIGYDNGPERTARTQTRPRCHRLQMDPPFLRTTPR